MQKEIFISLSFFILLFNFCEKQIIPEFITDDNTSALFNSGLELDAINNEIEISFDINVKWSIEVMYKNASGWCNVTPLIGEIGKNNILIKVDENSSYEDIA